MTENATKWGDPTGGIASKLGLVAILFASNNQVFLQKNKTGNAFKFATCQQFYNGRFFKKIVLNSLLFGLFCFIFLFKSSSLRLEISFGL